MSIFKTFTSSSTSASNSTSNNGGNASSTNASSGDSSFLDDLASYKVDPYSNAIVNGYTTVPN